MVVLVPFSFISVVNGSIFGLPSVVVETEVELRNAISAAPDESYMIGLSEDIVFEKSLEIPKDKRIILRDYLGGDIVLSGGDGVDVITVKNGGSLTLSGLITIAHADGDKGRGVYVERGGALYMDYAFISGNAAKDGGGVYVERGGTFYLDGGVISGNTATNGGGVYNNGYFWMGERSKISGNTATKGGGVYNNGNFTMNSGAIYENSAKYGNMIYDTSGTFSSQTERDNDIYVKNNNDKWQFYLLSVAVVGCVVAGILFYHSKKSKQLTKNVLIDSTTA